MKNLYNVSRRLNTPKNSKFIAGKKLNYKIKIWIKNYIKKTPYYFSDRVLAAGFNIILDSHQVNHANSKLNVSPNNWEFEILRFFKIFKEMATLNARITSHYEYKI